MSDFLDITILPTYSEDGSVVTFILSKQSALPITREEMVECLIEYARHIEEREEELRN